MSDYQVIEQMAEQIEAQLETAQYRDSTLEVFSQVVNMLGILAAYLRAIELLLEGYETEDEFHKRLGEELERFE